MPNQDIIAQLVAYKLKDRFTIDDWEDREAVPTSRATISYMRHEGQVVPFPTIVIYSWLSESLKIRNTI